ncbi:MAG: hypothetical protein HC896_12060 [Bacteroidales bacterium]|nr:hypothetical protein [Bacteroidales bacterium]
MPSQRDTTAKAGIQLCKKVKKDDPYLPFIFQSSDVANKAEADKLDAGFIHKYAGNLEQVLCDAIVRHMPFGPFSFRHTHSGQVYAKAGNLAELQKIILNIPDEIYEFHANRNHFSKWLNARALFGLGNIVKAAKYTDFGTTMQAKLYVQKAIMLYRAYKTKGTMASFDPDHFDGFLQFSRIGQASVGGKARGLAFIQHLIKKHKLENKFANTQVAIPRTVAIGLDVFEDFMRQMDFTAK